MVRKFLIYHFVSLNVIDLIDLIQGPILLHLMIFHHNSNLMEILFCSQWKLIQVITAKFRTWNDSYSVMASAKICSNMIARNQTTAKKIKLQAWKLLIKWTLDCKFQSTLSLRVKLHSHQINTISNTVKIRWGQQAHNNLTRGLFYLSLGHGWVITSQSLMWM